MTALVVRADSRRLPLPDSSVDLVCTSPPYFGLRSYQDGGKHYEGQVGDEATPAEFVAALLEVTAECVRVLKPSGSIWVNLGDKYAGSNGQPGGKGSSTLVGTTSHTRGMAASKRPPKTDVRPKSLIGLPWRYALACIDDLGLILRAEVIWSKPNGLPESVTDRVRRSHETWFHFTKEPRYYAGVDEIREPHLTPGIGGPRRNLGSAYTGEGRIGSADGTRHLDGNPLGKLPGSVWTIPTQPLQVPAHLGVDHFAAFPMEWPRRIIKGWSSSGICIDCGEGRAPTKGESWTWGSASSEAATRARRAAEAAGLTPAEAVGMRGTNRLVADDDGEQRRGEKLRGNPLADLIGYRNSANLSVTRTSGAEACACPTTDAPTRPAVVLDPFGGTGTTALVASALGRTGISVDLSHDYSRLARWRTSDPGQRASAMQVEKPPVELAGQADLFGDVA